MWLAAAALAAPQEPKPFSHKLHLKQVGDCGNCHTAANSEKASDDLMPGTGSCAACHADVEIKKARATGIAKFSHKLHLALGNPAKVLAAAIQSGAYLSPAGDAAKWLAASTNACTSCHRGLDESDVVSRMAFPNMADCLVCHPKVDPPFSCGFCHEKGFTLRPATHTKDYLESHANKKAALDKASCAVCHGRKFTCMGCH